MRWVILILVIWYFEVSMETAMIMGVVAGSLDGIEQWVKEWQEKKDLDL